MHVAEQLVAQMVARVGQVAAVVDREIHRLRVQHLAAAAEIGGVAGGQHGCHVMFADLAGFQHDLSG